MNLKNLRQKQKLTRVALARILGCHKQQIYNFETGKAPVPEIYIGKLCRALKISEAKYVYYLVTEYRKNILNNLNKES